MEEQKKVILTGSIVIVLAALIIVVYYFFIRDRAKEALPVQDVVEELPVQTPEDKPAVEEAPAWPGVSLDDSDEIIRQQALSLSSHQLFAVWLKSKSLVRKFVAAVDNIANGQSPKPQVDFFTLEEPFRVTRRGGRFYADPRGYSRYNMVADISASLDARTCAVLYKQLRPLIQEAYRELGYPDEDFDLALHAAIVELLRVPVVKGEMLLERKVFSFAIADPRLENMSEAQKHLLRMGPENVRKIQEKIRELAGALGIPETRLPRPITYTPRAK